MKLDISQEEREALVTGLQMRICYIETGDPCLRAQDALNMGKPNLVKPLNDDQKVIVLGHAALIKKVLMAR